MALMRFARASRLCSSCLLVGVSVFAQPSVDYSAEKKVWTLHTDSSALALGVNPRGELINLYWGGPLWRADDVAAATNGREMSSFDPAQSLLNEEYPGWGGTRYAEPAVKVTRSNGGRDLVLHYSSHAVDGENLKIVLKDVRDEIYVTLNYHVYAREGIIRKSALLENRTRDPLEIESPSGGRLVPASRDRLPAVVCERPLGGGKPAFAGADPSRREGARKPQGAYEP